MSTRYMVIFEEIFGMGENAEKAWESLRDAWENATGVPLEPEATPEDCEWFEVQPINVTREVAWSVDPDLPCEVDSDE